MPVEGITLAAMISSLTKKRSEVPTEHPDKFVRVYTNLLGSLSSLPGELRETRGVLCATLD